MESSGQTPLDYMLSVMRSPMPLELVKQLDGVSAAKMPSGSVENLGRNVTAEELEDRFYLLETGNIQRIP